MNSSAQFRSLRSWQWARRNLFASVGSGAVTLLCVTGLFIGSLALGKWLIVDARWLGTSPVDCAGVDGACWPFVWDRLDQFLYGLYPAAERWRVNLGVALAAALLLLLSNRHVPGRRWLAAGGIPLCVAVATLLFAGGHFGLPRVPTSQWGGFFLTLVVSTFVLGVSLPAGILLALGRLSKIPLVRALCGAWVEFWRAMPAIVLLFVVIIMLPLFTPPGVDVDKLLRALIALALLMSAYLAEVMRGVLQTIPAGQMDAAAALGLGYRATMGSVVLPQALTVAAPQITSQFIGLFKETTLLVVVGFYDLLGMVQTASTDPAWLSASSMATGYLFTALLFWTCCFGMSRYAARLESRRRRSP